VFVSTERHECSPYCRDGAHAELLYREETEPPTTELVQSAVDLVSPGRTVLDVQAVAEAPLPEGYTTAWLVIYGSLRDHSADLEAER
jgi:hypothetical protein